MKDYKNEYLTGLIHLQERAKNYNPNELAQSLINFHSILTIEDTDELINYEPETGLYEPAEIKVEYSIQAIKGDLTTTRFVNETVNAIKRQTRIPRDRIGADLNLIPLQNGVYDFRENKLIQYNHSMIFLNKHKIVYNSEAQGNKIDEFLSEVVATQEDVLMIKEMIGYCFYRSMPFHTIFILVGKGNNGKTVVLNLIEGLLGEHCIANKSLQQIVENRFCVSGLFGKNANIFGDLGSKAFNDTGILKQLSGGDTIEGARKFKGDIKFKNYAKLIASCNELPESPDMSDGFYRRWHIINFPFNFEGKEKRNLAQQLLNNEEEVSCFFNSCMDAFRQVLRDNRFIRQESTDEKKRKYINYSNSAAAFCQEELDYDPEEQITTIEVYNSYKEHCRTNNIIAKDERVFFQKLYKYFGHKVWKKRLVGDDRTRRYFIVGIYWKKDKNYVDNPNQN